MGQYYKPCILKDKEQETDNEVILAYMNSHDYDTGLKLMQHSWIRNTFVSTFEHLIAEKRLRIVWAGDYADEEPNTEVTLYKLCNDTNRAKPKISKKVYRYVINHSEKLYVDKRAVPITQVYKYIDKKGVEKSNIFRIHPLPLLTCEGNGGGGGDFYGQDGENVIGTWARDIVSVSNNIPEGYKELKFNLKE